ncbi:MAG: hypothetical protein FJ145_04780 [Deltaproteobacteria bacterium]|nr:hypothetical protein [Deltaproteobacteria bacterium]
MLTRFWQHRYVTVGIGVLLIGLIAASSYAQNKVVPRSAPRAAANPELARLRADVLEKMKESHAGAQKLLALHEEEKKRVYEEYLQRRELYHQGLIARVEVAQAERALANAILRVDEEKKWLAESEIAITEASTRDIILGLPILGAGGYSETAAFIRFNGTALWSIADSHKIEAFFTQTFGRGLPISAFGQTPTHDRLRFDHRNAMDVALHPDSAEGQSLLSYLRRSGIPFIAFRNAIAGSSTGAHIHIGHPSPAKN